MTEVTALFTPISRDGRGVDEYSRDATVVVIRGDHSPEKILAAVREALGAEVRHPDP